jgi:hypothetical protein
MTSDAEARFIDLWQQGLATDAIAAALGIPRGTVGSRAKRLVAQGKIQPRPRGGAYPRQQALARQHAAGVSADTSGVSTRVSPDIPQKLSDNQPVPGSVSARVSADTPPVQYLPPSQDDMRPLLTDILQELRQLTSGLAARVSADTPPLSRDTPGVSGRTPLPAERGKSVRWNLHLSEGLRDRIKARAQARGLQDSQMVEELCWLALSLSEEAPTDGL